MLVREYVKDTFDQINQHCNEINGYLNLKNGYNGKDSGTYTVTFKYTQQNGRDLHPINLGKRLSITKIATKGFNRVGLSCNTFKDANKL